jgi:hypothetical protein
MPAQIIVFFLSHRWQMCHDLRILDRIIKILWKKEKKIRKKLKPVRKKIETGPDRPDPDRYALDADHGPYPDPEK